MGLALICSVPRAAPSVRSRTYLSRLLPCAEAAPAGPPSLRSWTGRGEMPLIPGLVAGEAWHFVDLLLALGSVECLDSHAHKARRLCLLWNLRTHDRARPAKEQKSEGRPLTLRSSRSSRRGGDASHRSEQQRSSNRAEGARAEPACQPPPRTAGLGSGLRPQWPPRRAAVGLRGHRPAVEICPQFVGAVARAGRTVSDPPSFREGTFWVR